MESGQQYYTGSFGHPGVKLTGIEHTKNIWDHAYHRITPISVSSGILFFIIFYLIATYIKYNIKHSKDKSVTYKQALKDSTIIIIAIDLSILVALLVYIFIDIKNPLPAIGGLSRGEVIYMTVIEPLIIILLLALPIYILLRDRKGKNQQRKEYK